MLRKINRTKFLHCNGRLLTGFQVGPEHLNQRGTLHGGFIAHLVDAISTYALTANDTIETRGVSIDLSVSYFSAAREGDNIEVEAVTRKLGKKIAFLEVEIRNKDKNQVLATGNLRMLNGNAFRRCSQPGS
ncbi:hypothetical protein MSG28_001057 [Choristoneura fumiferana]|uniref:Uncharacterized protein n=1 Tax=Choristoneura fumiferana TaxID=7141 RepID=A0ACC0K3L2_CHOFU|nr:hypothetical protein MSG28_001057 [Choristoneura fumiferana]